MEINTLLNLHHKGDRTLHSRHLLHPHLRFHPRMCLQVNKVRIQILHSQHPPHLDFAFHPGMFRKLDSQGPHNQHPLPFGFVRYHNTILKKESKYPSIQRNSFIRTYFYDSNLQNLEYTIHLSVDVKYSVHGGQHVVIPCAFLKGTIW